MTRVALDFPACHGIGSDTSNQSAALAPELDEEVKSTMVEPVERDLAKLQKEKDHYVLQ